MKLGRDEIFGPVAALTKVGSLDEAVDLMHEVEYGNATSIFTTSGKAAREFRYRAGISMIGVNIGVAAPMAFFPFGGSRGSFYGDLKAQGSDAISFLHRSAGRDLALVGTATNEHWRNSGQYWPNV